VERLQGQRGQSAGTPGSHQLGQAGGNERQKQVFANVLDVGVKNGSEDVDLSGLGDDMPRAENDNGVLRSRVPLSLLALKPGRSIRVTAKIGSCNPVVEKITVK
jgi:hypothetical protein